MEVVWECSERDFCCDNCCPWREWEASHWLRLVQTFLVALGGSRILLNSMIMVFHVLLIKEIRLDSSLFFNVFMFSCSCMFILHFLSCFKSLHTYIQFLSYVEQFILLYLSIAVQVQEYSTKLQQRRSCLSVTQVCSSFVFCSLSNGFLCPVRAPSQIFKFPGGPILLCHPEPVIKYPLCFRFL